MAKLRIEQGGETEEFQEQVFTAVKAGERLDVFCARVSDNTRSAVQRMINSGDVTINGAPQVKGQAQDRRCRDNSFSPS